MPNVSSLASEGIVFNDAFQMHLFVRLPEAQPFYSQNEASQYHRRMSLVKLPDDVKPLLLFKRSWILYVVTQKEIAILLKMVKFGMNHQERKLLIKRKKDQPFFHVQRLHCNTHEGQLHFDQEHLENIKTNNLDSIKPFPYHYADTPTFRYTQSLYHNTKMLIKEIEV